jgi:DNA-binding LytR/AlgR family response regulator
MKFVILEDEIPAYENLRSKLMAIMPGAWIYAQLFSVEQGVSFFRQELPADLVFADIHLRDGTSFDIFKTLPVKLPVVFVTAHDNFLQQAFEHNGIDYLLKPTDDDMLRRTLEKYHELKSFFAENKNVLAPFIKRAQLQRVIIRKGNDFQLVAVEDVMYFFSNNKLVFAVEKDGRKYLCDESNLTAMMERLDNNIFFRATRKYIISIKFLHRFFSDDRSRVIIKMLINPDEDIVVSQENGSLFRKWVGKE